MHLHNFTFNGLTSDTHGSTNLQIIQKGYLVEVVGHIYNPNGVGRLGSFPSAYDYYLGQIHKQEGTSDWTVCKPDRDVWLKWPLPNGSVAELKILADGRVYLYGCTAYTSVSVTQTFMAYGYAN